ncbi:MAG: transcription-repair coupling factor [Bacteroidales bacterium]
MSYTISKERFNSQEAVSKLIKEATSKGKEKIVLEGLYSSAKAFAISAAATQGIHIVLLNNREDAVYCSGDLYKLIDINRVFFFPSSKIFSRKNAKKDSSHQIQRAAAINAVKNFTEGNSPYENILLVGYPHSINELIINKKALNSAILKISKGDLLSHEFIKETLFEYSFERVDFVSEPGQFALRGGLIDLFSFSHNKPWRLDFFGDTVEKIKVFDIDTQRSLEEVESIDIFPDIYDNENIELEDIFSYLGEDATIWVNDEEYFSAQLDLLAQSSSKQESSDYIESRSFGFENFKEVLEKHKTFLFAPVTREYENNQRIQFHTVPQPVFNKNFELLARDISQKIVEGYDLSILSESQAQIERIRSIFSSLEGIGDTNFNAEEISIHEGFIDHNAKICLYTDHQIFERYRRVKPQRTVEKSERLTFNELNSYEIGDYIVHIDHGVGQFGGLVKTTTNDKQQEAVKLIYKDGDVIFVSIHGLHRISRYKSKDAVPPKIYKLGTGAWQKLKNQTKSKVKDIANDLIDLYSKRRDAKGFAFSADTYMQQELESSFIYEDTPDQLTATNAIKEDMELQYPMDRLICGDVGFGKTELAIRAAFKAVADSKQVAVLVPTTILALQHYNTFTRRLKEFPCNVSYMSRLKTAREIKEILESLERGRIDIIIGTHRLLNKQIKFKDLGLLVIDEEQKFGVAAKERLRQLKLNVDTLTLSATPIPRTLQFSLLGARDLSIINTPPPNRLPIQTEVIDFNEEIIRDAINYEVERGGQVFFVHNRVEDIRSIEEIIQRLCPNVETCIGHGQMESRALERTVLDFMMGDYDVMVATTIVENGIDIPNANTIIINQAQNFGLSDLHQLRGRVGRSNIKAFCYLVIPSMISLKEDARRRIRAIETFSDLGSGFNISMQDLDIRGAGNLLGAEQSGFVADMGFETYQRILGEAFAEIKEERGINESDQKSGREVDYITDCTIDTDLEILIPDSYVSITAEKIRLYKELDALRDEKELKVFIESVEDRFGPLPHQAVQLAFIVRLRWLAIELGFEKIFIKNGILIAWFVSNQLSAYYSSKKFTAILNFLQQQQKRFRVKEQKEKLYITVQNVKSVEQAYNIFLEMKL